MQAPTGRERSTRDAILYLVRRYPFQSVKVCTLLVLAGLVEGIGVLSLLPLLDTVAGGSAGQSGDVGEAILDAMRNIGVTPTVGTLLAVVVAGISVKAGLMALAMRQVGYATASMGADLRIDLINALVAARWRHFTEQPTGAIANAVSGEAQRASYVFMRTANALAGMIQVILYGVLAFVVSWYVTLGAVFFGGLMILLLRSLLRMSRQAGMQQTTMMKSLVDKLTDGLNVIKPLKAMAREEGLRPILEHESEELHRAQRRQAISTAALLSLQEAFIVVILAISVYVALERLELPFEQLLFMAFLFQRTINRIGEAQSHYQQLLDVESALWSITDATEEARRAQEGSRGEQIPRLTREIRFDDISYAYGVKPVFQHFSLGIRANSMTAITGASGVGKTTLIDLLTGLLRPDSGEIWIDDTPLSRANLRSWRSRIGYVPQEVVLLRESVYDNVALKDQEITRAEVEAALGAAEAWAFVEGLEDGIDSLVGEKGSKLSGGQRQRLAIARAIVRRPDLLILDEATASLDPETELAIAKTLQGLTDQMTILAVSHQTRLVELAESVIDIGVHAPIPVLTPRDSRASGQS